jgi:chromosome segregation ATPase
MINRSRITVDEATREVLDQLSTQLGQEPSWAAMLNEQIQGIRDAVRQVHAQATSSKLLEQLSAITRALQSQAISQAEGLAALSGSVQTLDKRMETHQGGLEGVHQGLGRLLGNSEQARIVSTQQGEATAALHQGLNAVTLTVAALQPVLGENAKKLNALQDAAQKVSSAVNQQQGLLEDIQLGQGRLLGASEQASIMAMQQRGAIESLQQGLMQSAIQQQSSMRELGDTLKTAQTLLRGMQAEQMSQRDALQSVTLQIEALSAPWWKKIFKRARSQ